MRRYQKLLTVRAPTSRTPEFEVHLQAARAGSSNSGVLYAEMFCWYGPFQADGAIPNDAGTESVMPSLHCLDTNALRNDQEALKCRPPNLSSDAQKPVKL